MKKFILFFSLLTAPIFCDAPIDPHGFWTDENPGHCFDEPVAKTISEFLKKEKATSVVDLGAGNGKYVQYLRANNIEADGFDGNPNSPKISNNTVQVADLSQPLNLKKKYDWVLSLEVGEHLPPEFEKVFVENLHKNNTSGIILSWAVEGQPGLGHFNCHNNDYIKKLMASYGYENDKAAEDEMRSVATLWWFKNTIMVFRKPKTK